MINQTFIGQKGSYAITKILGKGGEGIVYELANNSTQVLKLYSEQISADKIRKLKLMVSISNHQFDTYTAWVKDIVSDSRGNVCGFVMKKLVNFVPLHMLFSPMDRKKLFPDKGYNFLVHVARNLAMAFQACHTAGLIIGDVNEGNILVNNQGMVAFIDCDSFQIKQSDSYHFCEVGVPRYTPPELLEKVTFTNQIRTINTDSFSMAVLIFQLLFLGRHPFAGRNNSNEDIDEETAIKRKWFAYSIRKNNILLPPNGTYNIKYLSDGLIDLFHNSFERNENRPVALNYVKQLGDYLNELIVCKKAKIHIYPSKLSECPWCIFQEKSNILYFLDDGYMQKMSSLDDIEKFVNGFKIEKINYSRITFPSTSTVISNNVPIDKKYINFKSYHRMTLGTSLILGLILSFISFWFIAGGVLLALILHYNLPWDKKIKEELKKRNNDFENYKRKLKQAIEEFNSPSELKKYENSAKQVDSLITRFKNLPNELQVKKRVMEERIYTNQLNDFLSQFEIKNYPIPSFGATRKLSLYRAGITTAEEISKLNRIKVQGIGPAFEQILFSWQRQVGSKFVYHPDNNLLSREANQIVAEIEQTKRLLETEIKNEYRSLNYLKVSLTSKQEQLKKFINVTTIQYFQAEYDYETFKKMVA